MAVEALCTVFTVPGLGQHRIDARYLYGAPEEPARGCYEVTYDRVYVATRHPLARTIASPRTRSTTAGHVTSRVLEWETTYV